MKKRAIELCIGIILLLTGAVIYIAYRTEDLAMFHWFKSLGLKPFVDWLRGIFSYWNPSYFTRYCLPDALWASSYILIADSLVSEGRFKICWVLLMPLIAIVLEILQIFNLAPGTFDFGDLFCFGIPVALYLLYYFIKGNRNV